jgi:hypothetical protein
MAPLPVTGCGLYRAEVTGSRAVRDGVVVETTSAADDVARGAEASGADRYVEALAALPGAEHVAVVDVAGEQILGEWGGPPGSARAVLDRARRAADPSRRGRRELEDAVSTTASAFHLSRLVLAGPGHPESVWVAVRISRARGSLTWSRGVLAGLDGPAAAPLARSAPPKVELPQGDDEAADPPPASVVPPPPAAASTKILVALTASVKVATSAQVPTAAETAITVELAAPEPSVPAARPSPEDGPEDDPEPLSPVPEQRSSFAPVMVVPPPASPVPDDGTTEEPAPMPAPTITAPPLTDEPRVLRRFISGWRRPS